MSLMPLKIKRLKKKLLPLNPLNPRITFKKAKSSAELVKLNQNYNPSSLSLLKHERLSLKSQQSNVHQNTRHYILNEAGNED
jgi:hypothetical protein